MRTIIIIQARMGSSRLPGKVLMPLGESCVLDYVVTRCKAVNGIAEVVVATTALSQDDPIVQWCAENGVAYARGSEEDVLQRFVDAAGSYSPDWIIRVTSDCPFVDYELASDMTALIGHTDAVLIVWSHAMPRGLAVEPVSYGALLKMAEVGTEPRHREHVTYYAHEYPQAFRRTAVQVPAALQYPALRITLDTEEDYALCKAIAEAFPGDKLIPSTEVVSFLNLHPDIRALNAHIEQKPVV
ncbi:spore coat polysaccharide biosynthesis protein SpsF [Cohnella sp. OV330]|uniref:cytidylyltransferase domain-containing protein n=1 Tax=Cohnella sp. OV330 TaxID=1855288 RepID=UPI0008EBC81E|nr:glycosyltransferase family protein [Cohnella sp. OV330]SFB47973.1 spore coat polysaccharide biosynthesis protein SpsF [Cohnella sp. OV330]